MKPPFVSARLRAALSSSIEAARRVRAGRRASSPLSRLWRAALPNHCAMCGNLSQRCVCEGCHRAYWQDRTERCQRCALPLPGSAGYGDARRPSPRLCGACLAAPPDFDATLALADYREPLAQLAVELKFHARLAIAHDLARRLALAVGARGGPAEPRIDLIIPVPLSASRLAARGYNQAWEIARPLAHRLGIRAAARATVRVADTPPQAQLDAAARHRNMHAAFAVAAPIKGLHIAVVDDVMTSGATLDALARTLKRAGAARVTNLVAFRTPKD